MTEEKKNDVSSLETDFREHAKHYQRLLRWGLDKVFVDNPIASMLHDARSLIDASEYNKALLALADLKTQIHWFENQVPIKKLEIEKQQLIKISALEFQIETLSSLDGGESITEHRAALEQTRDYLTTLEFARIAIQNSDWPEAQVQIDKVDQTLLEFDIEPTKDTSKTESRSTIERLISTSSEEPTTLKFTRDAGEKEFNKAESNILKVELETPKLKPRAPLVTIEEPISEAVVNTSDFALTTAEKMRIFPKKTAVEKPNELGTTAQSLLATEKKSATGKLVHVKNLHRSFQMFNQANIESLRIGFIATTETINSELLCFSRKSINLKPGDKQIALIRLPISPKLIIYLLGIPLDFDKTQVKYSTSQFSAFFINTKAAEEDCVIQLTESLSKLAWLNSNIYIKDHANVQSFKTTRPLDKLKFLAPENNDRRFIEDAAAELNQFSNK